MATWPKNDYRVELSLRFVYEVSATSKESARVKAENQLIEEAGQGLIDVTPETVKIEAV